MFLSPLISFGECLLPKRTNICQGDKSHLKVKFTLQNSGNSEGSAGVFCCNRGEGCIARRVFWECVKLVFLDGVFIVMETPGDDDVELLSQAVVFFQESS